LISHEQNT